jgi:hypothetical protein
MLVASRSGGGVFGDLRRTMQASTSSPRTVSGVAATPHAATAGCSLRTLSTSIARCSRRCADHVLAPVDEVEVAFGAAPDDVAGVEPAVGHAASVAASSLR